MNENYPSLYLAGAEVASQALAMTGSNFPGDSPYGEFILHIAKQTEAHRVMPIISGSIENVDSKSQEECLAYVDGNEIEAQSLEYWKLPVNQHFINAGKFAAVMWKDRSLEADPEVFKRYQDFFFDTVVLNHVIGMLTDNKRKKFIERAVGKKGILSKLFGG